MTLTQTHHFCVRKFYCHITLICPINLISHIAQLLLIRKFYCFRPGPHISFKYARHNHLRCPTMNFVKFLRTPFFYRTPPVAASAIFTKRLTIDIFQDLKYVYESTVFGFQINNCNKIKHWCNYYHLAVY